MYTIQNVQFQQNIAVYFMGFIIRLARQNNSFIMMGPCLFLKQSITICNTEQSSLLMKVPSLDKNLVADKIAAKSYDDVYFADEEDEE